eukprot:CAMPEP_0185840954 /NCGR_PEP_ID=MMETSP1353-20130828/17073_1 /TAXON_ID=1077150 /ORGANISM="Erythrolobus australicus, Strain CCMP3124" /LENGTH=439 /DNA_ID=CAMNT_0028540345 /DNA_START=256 /DNA_END=1572 /DNA_ORIENTATION=-
MTHKSAFGVTARTLSAVKVSEAVMECGHHERKRARNSASGPVKSSLMESLALREVDGNRWPVADVLDCANAARYRSYAQMPALTPHPSAFVRPTHPDCMQSCTLCVESSRVSAPLMSTLEHLRFELGESPHLLAAALSHGGHVEVHDVESLRVASSLSCRTAPPVSLALALMLPVSSARLSTLQWRPGHRGGLLSAFADSSSSSCSHPLMLLDLERCPTKALPGSSGCSGWRARDQLSFNDAQFLTPDVVLTCATSADRSTVGLVDFRECRASGSHQKFSSTLISCVRAKFDTRKLCADWTQHWALAAGSSGALAFLDLRICCARQSLCGSNSPLCANIRVGCAQGDAVSWIEKIPHNCSADVLFRTRSGLLGTVDVARLQVHRAFGDIASAKPAPSTLEDERIAYSVYSCRASRYSSDLLERQMRRVGAQTCGVRRAL